jgi:hypothetical protein
MPTRAAKSAEKTLDSIVWPSRGGADAHAPVSAAHVER